MKDAVALNQKPHSGAVFCQEAALCRMLNLSECHKILEHLCLHNIQAGCIRFHPVRRSPKVRTHQCAVMREHRSSCPAQTAACTGIPMLVMLLMLAAAPQRSAAQGLLLGDRLGATPSLGRLLDGGAATAGASSAAATNPGAGLVGGGASAGGISGPFTGVGAAGAAAREAGTRAPPPAPASANNPFKLLVKLAAPFLCETSIKHPIERLTAPFVVLNIVKSCLQSGQRWPVGLSAADIVLSVKDSVQLTWYIL